MGGVPTLGDMPSAQARELLAARARRVTLIRRRVVAAVLATFVLAWGVIAFDGSMGATAEIAASTASPQDTSTSPSSSSSDDGATLTTSQS